MPHQNRVPHDRRPIAQRAAMLAGALVFVGVLAVLVVGPGRAIYWAVNLLIPVVVILVVVVGTVGLVAREGGKVLDSRDQPPSRTFVGAPQGEGFSRAVYWLVVSLFLLASVAMTYFFWLVIRDYWLHERLLVAGRFDEGETLRVLFALLALVAVASGLLWRHYRRIDSYGSPLEPFFMVVFTLCGALAVVVVLPALLAG
jgi:magnesium-transporting ATPase (P-type)